MCSSGFSEAISRATPSLGGFLVLIDDGVSSPLAQLFGVISVLKVKKKHLLAFSISNKHFFLLLIVHIFRISLSFQILVISFNITTLWFHLCLTVFASLASLELRKTIEFSQLPSIPFGKQSEWQKWFRGRE
ncbi:hypothetical protein DY000_02026905 [Brassica cretica]|uniref:Uncharacterized protein n=1 Tax=Brassica cretica TaxID=69181 RepID=A0ABQ7EMF3_BRACR|nr:hypothetical protein DY000_02026905 [Brassica cretica]